MRCSWTIDDILARISKVCEFVSGFERILVENIEYRLARKKSTSTSVNISTDHDGVSYVSTFL